MTQISKIFLKPKFRYRLQWPLKIRITRGYGSACLVFQFFPPVVRIEQASISIWLSIGGEDSTDFDG
jgi:hypothetical protein